MRVTKGVWLLSVGLVILGFWLSMMPLYKYPISTDPFYGYVNAVVWTWLVAGPTLMAIGLALEVYDHRTLSRRQ